MSVFFGGNVGTFVILGQLVCATRLCQKKPNKQEKHIVSVQHTAKVKTMNL